MLNAITPFGYEDKLVRVVTDEETGEPLWVAKDICEILEYKEVSKTLLKLDDDEKGTKIIRTLGGDQEMLVINESGLYTLILRSNKPEAKKFKKWVTSEVLPSIRKTGSYGLHVSDSSMNVSLIELVQNSQRQTDVLIDLTRSMMSMIQGGIKKESQDENPKISSLQKQQLRDAINKKADEISGETGMSKKSLIPGIWSEMKYFFDLSDYTDLEQRQLKDVLHWIMFYEPRTEKKKHVVDFKDMLIV